MKPLDYAPQQWTQQAITTAFRAPTDRNPNPRVTARCFAGRLTVTWDDRLDVESNHRAAALALARKLNWVDGATWYGGSVAGAGYAWVCVTPRMVAP